MTELPEARRSKVSVEVRFGRALFFARWLMAPFYVGLVLALALLMIVFVHELFGGAAEALRSPEHAILLVLSLIDLSLAGNLVVIVMLSGYENFVSKIHIGEGADRPAWLGSIDFSGMKLIGSIVAISTISLLRAFMQLAGVGEEHGSAPDAPTLAWMVGLNLTFALSGVLFALMDWLAEKASKGHGVDHGQA